MLAWGEGGGGALGDGTLANRSLPGRVQLASGLRATAIGSGPDANSAFAIVIR